MENICKMSQHQVQTELDTLRDELASLLADRKENLNGNMAFSFGYDPSVAAVEQQISLVQARVNILLDRRNSYVGDSKVSRKVVIYEEDDDEYSYYEVGALHSNNVGNHYTVNEEAPIGPTLKKCEVGQITSLGLVVSVDGSPLLPKEQHQEAIELYNYSQRAALKKAEEERARQRVLAEEIELQKRQNQRQENEKQRQENEANAERRRRQQAEYDQEVQRQHKKELERQLHEAVDAPCIKIHEVETRLQQIRETYQKGKSDKATTIHNLSVLLVMCRKSYDAASTHQNDSTNVGAVVGGLIGLIAGPFGAMLGAGIGAAIGSSDKEPSERDRWEKKLQDVKDCLQEMTVQR